MAAFDSWKAYRTFAEAILHESRFRRPDKVEQFLFALDQTLREPSAEPKTMQVPAGTELHRAQVGFEKVPDYRDGEFVLPGRRPYSPERMMPLRRSAHEGRVNPRGIPCLYTASCELTAVSEVRPAVGAFVSLATLRTVRPVTLVGFGHLKPERFFHAEPSEASRDRIVWNEIGRAFSKPIDGDPAVAEYAPTQVIAEHIRHLGYDGLAYMSRLGPSLNIALFDIDAAVVLDVRLAHIAGVEYRVQILQGKRNAVKESDEA